MMHGCCGSAYGAAPFFEVSSGIYPGTAGARSNGFGDITGADVAAAIGQCLKGGVAGAGAGTAITPGIGTAVGAGVGCVSSMLIGILTGSGVSDAQAQQMVAQQQAMIQAQILERQKEEQAAKEKQQYLILGGLGLAAVVVIALTR